MNAFVVALLWLGFSEKLVFISSVSMRSHSEGDRERQRRSLDDEKLDLLCGDARAFFRGKGLLEKGRSIAQQGETSPVADAELKICATTTTTTSDVERRHSCCTSEMEHQLQVLSFSDMRQVMSSSMTPVRHDLIVAMNSFTDEFRAILRAFENSTFHILANTFRIPTSEVHLLLDKLISRLIASSSKGQTSDDQLIGKVIGEFYDELFIAAVHNLLKFNVSADSNGEGKRCLAALRKDTTLMPFGDYPTLFEQHFRRSQGAALMFASGLQLVSDYFNVTVNEDLAEKCLQSVTRMTYCPLCQGLTNAVPCPEKCAWVLRDCRHALLGVSDGIRRFAGEAIDSVQAELSTISDAVLPSMVSKSLLKVIETGHMYRNQIVKKCGFRKSNGSGSLSTSTIPSNNVKTLRDGDGLRQTLERLRIILIRTSDLLAALPTTFCNTTKTSSETSAARCWNGTSLQPQSTMVEERMESEGSMKDTESASNTYTARLLNDMTSMLQGLHRRPQKTQSKEDTETGAQITSGKTQRPPRLRPVKYSDAAAAAATTTTTDDDEDDADIDEDNDDQYSGGESGQRAIIADTLTSTMKAIVLTSRIPEANNAPLSSSNLIRQPTTVAVVLSLTTTILHYACCRSI